jgi:hypothetical protein
VPDQILEKTHSLQVPTHQTLGSLQLVPPFYSQTAPNPYIIKIYKDDGAGGVGSEIPLLDNIDWNVDYYNGMLFLQDYDASKIPAHARAFAYIGKMAAEVISSGSSGGGGGTGNGDGDAQYLVLSSTGSLSNERVFTVGTGLSSNDAGANGNFTVGVNDSVVATLTSSVSFSNGISGSLTQLSDGTSYLVAGSNVTITSASNGQVTISSPDIDAIVTVANGSDNRIATFSSSDALNGESNLTFDGTTFTINKTLYSLMVELIRYSFYQEARQHQLMKLKVLMLISLFPDLLILEVHQLEAHHFSEAI